MVNLVFFEFDIFEFGNRLRFKYFDTFSLLLFILMISRRNIKNAITGLSAKGWELNSN